jgi:hypothetical protein
VYKDVANNDTGSGRSERQSVGYLTSTPALRLAVTLWRTQSRARRGSRASDSSWSLGAASMVWTPDPARAATVQGSASKSFTRSTSLARSISTTADGWMGCDIIVPQFTPTAAAAAAGAGSRSRNRATAKATAAGRGAMGGGGDKAAAGGEAAVGFWCYAYASREAGLELEERSRIGEAGEERGEISSRACRGGSNAIAEVLREIDWVAGRCVAECMDDEMLASSARDHQPPSDPNSRSGSRERSFGSGVF